MAAVVVAADASNEADNPGLAEIVTDIVSGGTGSELYRVRLPEEYLGVSVKELSARLRADHAATTAGGVARPTVPGSTHPRTSGFSSAMTTWVVAESLGR
jgi:voltage-gated potassium channel